MEAGTPYMLYKDHANSKSNQQSLWTIGSRRAWRPPAASARSTRLLRFARLTKLVRVLRLR
eukprot:1562996-Heterocapsa_arctica.AAC.1